MDFVGLDKLSLLDYEDKVSCVLFCKPCNFRCPFCHNGDLVLNSENYIPWEEITNYLKDRRRLIDAVVFSGGEPTLMPDLIEKIQEVKEMGFLVKLDTNGTNLDVLKKLVSNNLLDYIAMDIKNNLIKYDVTSGVKNVNKKKLVEAIEYIKTCGVDYEFRTTLVKEFHNDLDVEEFGKLVNGAKRLFLQKFVDREGCIKRGLHEVSERKAKQFLNALQKYVKEINLRGY